MDRRQFLKASVAGLALSTVSGYAAELVGQKSKRVGLIGCGWYGKSVDAAPDDASALFRLSIDAAPDDATIGTRWR